MEFGLLVVATSSARVVMAIPPKQWFGGQDRRSILSIVLDLQQRFGSTFYHFDTTPFIFGDTRKQQDAIARLREYKPHLAIAPANYGLRCVVESEGGTRNVFTDILEIPLMMVWDHGLFGFPSQILAPLAETPEESRPGSMHRVSQIIDHPLMCHYPIDSAQVGEMRRLGMLHSDNVQLVPALAFTSFLDFGKKLRSRDYINDVAFVGNVFLSDRYQAKIDPSVSGRCREAVIAGKTANPTAPAWSLLTEHVEALSASEKAESGLDYDQSYFWHFANDLVGVQCNTHSRMQTLTSIKRNVAFYGAFVDPDGIPRLSESGSIEYKGYVHFSTELPQVYAGTRILVDVTNAAFISNCSTKPMCCFAAGGFSLFDYKPDVAKHLGSDIERVMFKDFDELNAKIDYFLTHEKEREQLSDHLRDAIRRKSDFTDSVYYPARQILAERAGSGIWSMLKDVGTRVFNSMTGDGPTPVQVGEDPDKPYGPVQRLVEVASLPVIYPNWAGAKLLSQAPIQIVTADSAWGNSAIFPIARFDPQNNDTYGALWLEVAVRIVSGHASLSILLKDDVSIDDRVIGVEDGSCILFFPLPASGMRGLLVRSTEVPSSVLEFTDIALVAEVLPRRTALQKFASRVFGRTADRALPVTEDPDRTMRPVRRLASIEWLPEISSDWAGAALISASPVQIQTADSAWGYSAMYPDLNFGASNGAQGTLWLQVKVRMIGGRASLGLLLQDGALAEEHAIGIEDGSCTLFFPLSATPVKGLIIRSAEVPSSVLEVIDMALVTEETLAPPQ
jgi:hypothetical protein